MNESVDPNEDTSTAGLGERRRRREAERARARAAGRSVDPPLTRRERRARDEALASGALMLGPEGLVPTGSFEPIPDPDASGSDHESGETEGAADTPAQGEQAEADPTPEHEAAHETSEASTDGSEAQATGAAYPNTRSGRRARRAAEAAALAEAGAAHDTGQEESAGPEAGPAPEDSAALEEDAAPEEGPAPDAGAAPGESAAPVENATGDEGTEPQEAGAAPDETSQAGPASDKPEPGTAHGQSVADRRGLEDAESEPTLQHSAGEPDPEHPAGEPDAEHAATFRRVTRRSLRARQADSPPPAQMEGSDTEQTSTGRRPVVRPPASAQATRGVDSTGGLTAIQRAVRDANTSGEGLPLQVEAGEADSPTSWGSAVDLPTVTEDVSGSDPQSTQAMPGVRRISARSLSQSPATSDSHPAAGAAEHEDPSVGTPTSAASAPSAATPVSAGTPSSPGTPTSATSAPSAGTPATDEPDEEVIAPISATSSPSAATQTAGISDADAPAGAQSPAESAETEEEAEEDEDTGAFDMKPRWEALGIAAQARSSADATPRSEAAPGLAPIRVSARRTRAEENDATQATGAEQAAGDEQAASTEVRPPALTEVAPETAQVSAAPSQEAAGSLKAEADFTEDPEDEDTTETRKTPAWLFALQIFVLVLVAVVLGLLVWQLAAGNLFDDEESLGAAWQLSTHALWSPGA